MRVICLSLMVMLAAVACRDKIICPAFQSTYILDDSARIAYFSYVWKLDEDLRQAYIASLDETLASSDTAMGDAVVGRMAEYFSYVERYNPPQERVRKNKFGIVRYEPYWLKNYKMKTAPMENILMLDQPEKDIEADSIFFSETDTTPMLATSDDSLQVAGDSTMVAAAPKPKVWKYRFGYDPEDNFNVEQDYYNKYFGALLLDLSPQEQDTLSEAADPAQQPDSLLQQSKKKGLKGLFKRKKDKDTSEEEGG